MQQQSILFHILYAIIENQVALLDEQIVKLFRVTAIRCFVKNNIAVGGSVDVNPSIYFAEGAGDFNVVISDKTVAESSYDSNSGKLRLKGLKAGMTKASISAGGVTQEFVITVRTSTGDYGWL